ALPIIRLLFQRGAFDSSATVNMTPVLIANALGLPFFSFVNLALRAFYAQKDTRTPVIAAVLSFVVNLILSFALMGPFGTVGLAIASTIAMAVQAGYLQWHLARKQEGLAFHHLAGDLGKIVATSLVMGGVVAALWWGWGRAMPATKWADAGGLTLIIGCGVLVYVALLWAVKIEGRDDLAALWLKVRAKFA
ncbi:MAG: lipid II flippase MurJ, partial [Opitutaceae bacterium]